ncbi:uncharacterized protein LOC111697983 [Eurytemora carolleeae]|uniref:uncharacterized protein LOC111697983 n=1 Tax=Eurytemora carolleeae TaxID=1294199 RepID=UPI000C791123|nr:uncharacterized protein LOC111697983 [Eurytemora carolleeae]|eukprot:XP_023323947.1 uncharacterized protein LOC111697983 [Eurytemora affinis]
MRIKFTNIGNPLRVDYPVLIVKGIIENFSQDVWKRFGEKSFMLMCHQRETDYKRCEEIPLKKLEFKFLVHLLPGSNLISLDFLGVKDTLNVLFDHKPVDYKVRLVYVVCQDSDGEFQGPEGEDCSIESAKARICLGAKLLQCITAETLWEAGVGRKTFRLETNAEGGVECHTLRVNLSTTECWKMTGEKLWENIGREIMLSNIRDEKIKYIGFVFARYNFMNTFAVQ